MADLKQKKLLQKVQRRDGLPKCCSVDEWLDLHRKADASPRLGGIVWYESQLCIAARIGGRVQVLPFSKFTEQNRFRDALNKADQATYSDLWKRAMAGEFTAFVERKRKERAEDGIGF